MNLETPLSDIPAIQPPRARQFARMGILTVGDLLMHLPRRYEDRTRFDHWPADETPEPVCLCGIVKKTSLRRIRGGQKMFDVVLEPPEAHALQQPLTLRWFNAHWVEKMIVNGQRLVVFGKPKRSGSNLVIAHPEFEAVDDDADVSIHLDRIVPIHGATEGLTPRMIRRTIWDLLKALDLKSVPTLLPKKLDPMERGWALRQIHFPDSMEDRDRARRHFVLEEFFGLQITLAARRKEMVSSHGQAHCGPGELMAQLHAALPFPLTGAQKRAIEEIRADLASAHPMNRLLHGDVGAGKTLVALSAMLLCVEGGWQAALMAPTQILAEQHYLNIRKWCDPLGINVALRTGARTEESGELPLLAHGGFANAAEGPQIFVGTHALLYERAGIERLGLAVIDEQHKFGVLQRGRLRGSGPPPDVLVMTATPIPRTLTMTLYGDLDVSTLDEIPPGRGRIITGVREATKLPDAIKFIRDQIESGRQAYIVYPLIDETERIEAKAAAVEIERWRTALAPMECALLHGRIPPEEKDAIMETFRRGKTKALVATTVIEVGIDVPNATVMLIENAERFGLAQLHQLRGRIGRGSHKSYCILLASPKADAAAMEKLRILEKSSDGFEIAEADLRLRGPGDLLGTAQTGLPPLRIGDMVADGDLMKLARNAAFLVIERDPNLELPEHAHFRAIVNESRRASLAQIA